MQPPGKVDQEANRRSEVKIQLVVTARDIDQRPLATHEGTGGRLASGTGKLLSTELQGGRKIQTLQGKVDCRLQLAVAFLVSAHYFGSDLHDLRF